MTDTYSLSIPAAFGPDVFCYLDFETTGLDPLSDEVLQVSLIDGSGDVLLDSYVRPVRIFSWPDAEAIHGISSGEDSVVWSSPTFADLVSTLREHLAGKILVAYNLNFERSFLGCVMDVLLSARCAMEEFAAYHARGNDLGYPKWHKLSFAADYIGHDFDIGDQHNSLHDARATRAVWLFLFYPDERERVENYRYDLFVIESAQRFLANQDAAREREEEIFSQRFSDFWMRWWRYPEWLDRRFSMPYHDLLSEVDRRREDCFYAFTGVSSSVWSRIYDCNLPVFRHGDTVPGDFQVLSRFVSLPNWISHLMEPEAIRVSRNGLRFYDLYSKSQPDEIRSRYPIRYVAGRVPDNLRTATWLKRRKCFSSDLKPVAQLWQMQSHQWVNLYEYEHEYDGSAGVE